MLINGGDQHSKYLLKDGNTLNIFQDEINDQNPREEYDHLGKMVCFHRRYNLGDKTDLKSDQFSGWNSLKNHLLKKNDISVIISVYMIDHSGISIRAGRDFSDCDPGLWDSGQIGFIYALRTDVLKWFDKKKISVKLVNEAHKILMGEIEIYNDYLTGNVYGYTVTDPAGEIVDSCYGFFGDPEKTIVQDFKDQIVPDEPVKKPAEKDFIKDHIFVVQPGIKFQG